MTSTCTTCGGALEAGGVEPPCLCELTPLIPTDPSVPQVAGDTGTHARALKCPVCGGWLETGARRCTYCSVELASVRCWRCFHLSFAGTANCAACGVALGLEGDLGPTEFGCPGCKTEALHRIDVGDHRINECPSCGGVHVDHETLERLTHAREIEAGVRMIGAKKGELKVEEVRYRPCPMCDKIMHRNNFGRRSGVIVDVCKDHGVWFDPHELTAVLEFVASGGLQETRERELQQAKDELSRRRSDALLEQARSASQSHFQPPAAHSGGALLSALLTFRF